MYASFEELVEHELVKVQLYVFVGDEHINLNVVDLKMKETNEYMVLW